MEGWKGKAVERDMCTKNNGPDFAGSPNQAQCNELPEFRFQVLGNRHITGLPVL